MVTEIEKVCREICNVDREEIRGLIEHLGEDINEARTGIERDERAIMVLKRLV